eukprot:808295-Prymnesium_polylepis.1
MRSIRSADARFVHHFSRRVPSVRDSVSTLLKSCTFSTVCKLRNPERSSVHRSANAPRSARIKHFVRGKTFAMWSSAKTPVASRFSDGGTSDGKAVRKKAVLVRNLMTAAAERGVKRGTSRCRTSTARRLKARTLRERILPKMVEGGIP